jgi:hypothetical protein
MRYTLGAAVWTSLTGAPTRIQSIVICQLIQEGIMSEVDSVGKVKIARTIVVGVLLLACIAAVAAICIACIYNIPWELVLS